MDLSSLIIYFLYNLFQDKLKMLLEKLDRPAKGQCVGLLVEGLGTGVVHEGVLWNGNNMKRDQHKYHQATCHMEWDIFGKMVIRTPAFLYR